MTIPTARRTSSSFPDAAPGRGGGRDAPTERERLLRSLLLDARDALVRQRVASPAGTARTAAAAVASEPSGNGNGTRPARASLEPAAYRELRGRLLGLLRASLPAGSSALVVSRGDARLLEVGRGVAARHFPADASGEYAGHHPADGAAAIAELEEQRRHGAGFLVLPETALWWLDHYPDLARHLEGRYAVLARDPAAGVVYDLRRPLAAARRVPRRRGRAKARRPFAAVTIISRNYLAQARVLARSFLEHEPESRFYLLVVDRLPEGVDVGAPVTLVDPAELDLPGFWEMGFKYGVVEFSTAVKPYLLALLLRRYGEEEVVYFDPDILVLRPLGELREALAAGDIVVTPHITRPLPLDGKRPNEQDIMISGVFNLGFLALRRSAASDEFLDWWQERLQDGCRIDVANGLFTDQKWVDLAPSLFPSTVVLRDTAYNIAFWNLHERELSLAGGELCVNGGPAAFCHISGFSPDQPRRLSKHQNRIEVEEGSALAALLDRYAALLRENGWDETRTWEYGYERFHDGTRVHPLLRQIYLKLSGEERGRFGDPFAPGGPGSFLDWATAPRPNGELSPFLHTLYRVRYDLPLAFPDVRGRDRKPFLTWARRWGSAEMGYPPELVRDEPVAVPEGAAPREAKRPAAIAAPAATPASGARRSPRALPHQQYAALIESVRSVARATLPAAARVLVVSRGDYRLVDLGGVEGWHFPQTPDGVYGGYHPADSAVAIAHLEALREKGAGYLLIPSTALWWLDHYAAFRRHLEKRYRPLVQDRESCFVYALEGPPARLSTRERRGARARSLGRAARSPVTPAQN